MDILDVSNCVEAWFHQFGHVHSQNSRIPSAENPQPSMENSYTPLKSEYGVLCLDGG
jgi:hypothetical protein